MFKKILIIITVFIVVSLAIWFFDFSKEELNNNTDENILKEVNLISVKNFQNQDKPLSLVGEVTSKNEVTVKTEVSGQVMGVYAKVGKFLNKNTVIAEIENSSLYEAVLSARANVESKEATLQKTQKGSRDEQMFILELKLNQADNSLKEAKKSTINTLQSVYAVSDDTIRGKVDQFFDNPGSSNPTLSFILANSQLKINIEFNRFVIGKNLEIWSEDLSDINIDDNLFVLLNKAEQNLIEIRGFLDDTALAVNSLAPNSNLTQTTISTWQSAVSVGRVNINTSLSNVSSVRDNLNNKITAYNIAKKQQEEGLAGGREEDVFTAERELDQAKSTLKQAQLNFEKTIIKSPITGILNSIDIKNGDFVSAFEPIGIVSNNNALEITTFITEDDADFIKIGAEAFIEDTVKGTVYEIAPTLDKNTKKLEIKIAIEDTKTDLIKGESVELKINRSFMDKDFTKDIIVPISSLKVKTDGVFVFTINEDNKLIGHKVSAGSIVGNGIIVLSGVTSDMNIVLDARGLEIGQEVLIR